MSVDSAIIPMCDIHHEDVAQALCHYHKKLLCLSCVLEKAKSPECSFTELRKISGDKDTLMVECLSVKQMTAKKKRLLDDHEQKTSTLKDKLEKNVIELHDELTTRLVGMKDKCLMTIDKSAKTVTAGNEQIKQQLVTLETAINDTIDKLSAESIEDVVDIQTKLKEVKTEVMENIPDKDTVPEGDFKPNDHLREIIMKSGASLGHAYLIDQERYAKVGEVTDGARDRTSKPWYASSDEIVYGTEKGKLDSAKADVNTKQTGSLIEASEKQSSERSKREQSTEIDDKSQTSPGGKSGKTRGGIFKWFSFDKRKSDLSEGKAKGIGTDTKEHQRISTLPKKRTSSGPDNTDSENIYQDSTFYRPSYMSPKYLINKTVMASDMRQQFPSACKFSKLVDLGDGYIGMLSEIHNSLVLLGTDGHVFGKKTFKEGKHNIAAVGNQEIAVIAEPGLQVSKFKVSGKGFTIVASFIVNEEISNITGFDFDITSSKFAVSSVDKVIVLDKSGKKLKAVPYGTTKTPETNEIATTYDFKNDCLYILNIKDKTLKMFSLEKSDAVWKRRFESHSVMPRSMCHYKDKLCIACGDAVAIFSAISGKPIVKHDTNDLLDDCLGICVIDEVLVLSSNSDNLEKSTTLAYVSL
ncbi:uncharacterized protein LOC123529577 [Mercenaria mercenaria]|uniref:uncharacterized protein LOC123529577 n=1 Tax=Mercenaria mercenaria TaxID=6596 RepID=UPI00234EF95C|nr:uncharacterized protein LOC123529577 [Mercenaria mercenaria]XP_045165892.2 uncharacterized protein LOC123529577 [Mercenaria mercenaria]